MPEILTSAPEAVVEQDIARLILPKKISIKEFCALCKVSASQVKAIFDFHDEEEVIRYEDASEIAWQLGIPTQNVVHLPPTISINRMATLCRLKAEDIMELLHKEHKYKEKDLKWHKTIQYGIAKQVAAALWVNTRKVLKQAEFDDDNRKLFGDYKEMSILHEFETHNPEFNMIDTCLIPIFLMKDDESISSEEYKNYTTLYKVKGDDALKDMFAPIEQMQKHIQRLAKRLWIGEKQITEKLQHSAYPVENKDDFSLLDTSDIAIYLKKWEADKTWYADNYEHLKREKAPEDDLELLIEFLAATSIRTHLKGNVKKAFKEYTIYKKWLEKWDLETPVKWDTRFHAVKVQLDHIKNRKKLGWRKIQNFAQAMKGDPDAVVVDMWIMRAYKLGSDRSPTRKQYDQVENHIKMIAKEIGWQPREVCSAIWGWIRAPFDDDTRYEGTISKHRKPAEKSAPLPDLRKDQGV